MNNDPNLILIRDILFSKKSVETFREAIFYFGIKSQLEKTVEECVELADATTKIIKNLDQFHPDFKARRDNMIDEIADVMIMIMQSSMILDPCLVAERIQFKIDRLEKLNQELHDKIIQKQ